MLIAASDILVCGMYCDHNLTIILSDHRLVSLLKIVIYNTCTFSIKFLRLSLHEKKSLQKNLVHLKLLKVFFCKNFAENGTVCEIDTC